MKIEFMSIIKLFSSKKRIYNKEKVINMESKKKNPNIHCTVKQCEYNCISEDYCSLEMIKVGTHESDPKVPECTDCNSFVRRPGCCG